MARRNWPAAAIFGARPDLRPARARRQSRRTQHPASIENAYWRSLQRAAGVESHCPAYSSTSLGGYITQPPTPSCATGVTAPWHNRENIVESEKCRDRLKPYGDTAETGA